MNDHSMVLKEVAEERARQDARWGVQDLPDGTGPYCGMTTFHGLEYPGYAELADRMKQICDAARDLDMRCMAYVLLEEVFEALAEDDHVRLREELVQVAAVAVKWVQMIDRRNVCDCGADDPPRHPHSLDCAVNFPAQPEGDE